MAKKNLFNAETLCNDCSDSMIIQKKAVISYTSLIPRIEAHGRSIPLSNKGFGIGRDKTNSVIVSDPEVSKYHAHMTFRKGKAFIQDSGSTNGTWINETRIPEGRSTALNNKDIIIVGTTQIVFKC